MAGMPEPAVVNTLRSRKQQLDDAESAAVNGTPAKAAPAPEPIKGAPSPSGGFFKTLKHVLGMGGINPDGSSK